MPVHANVDFSAQLEAALLVGMVGGWAFLLLVWFVAWWRMKPRVARAALWLGFIGTFLYFCLLYGFAWKSKEKTLARGAEKYFCELDCHLAYSVVGVEKEKSYQKSGAGAVYQVWKVSIQTRFDEKTISHGRGNGPLTPNLHEFWIVAKDGRQFRSDTSDWVEFRQPLRPGESYVKTLSIWVPPDVKEPRLLISEAEWPSYIGIGSENSPGHKKTYFALE
jgi:hypothetical protein